MEEEENEEVNAMVRALGVIVGTARSTKEGISGDLNVVVMDGSPKDYFARIIRVGANEERRSQERSAQWKREDKLRDALIKLQSNAVAKPGDKVGGPKIEDKRVEAPKVEEPKVEEPKVEEPNP